MQAPCDHAAIRLTRVFSKRALLRSVFAAVTLGLLPPALATAQTASPVPEKRFALAPEIDLPGGDLATVFDTTLEACARAGRPLAMEPMRSDLARMEEALERLQKRVGELDAPEETVP